MCDNFIFGDYVKIENLRPEKCMIDIDDETLMERIDCYFGGYTTKESDLCAACRAICPKTAKACGWSHIIA